MGLTKREGITLVPLSIYFNDRAPRQGRDRPGPAARRRPTSAKRKRRATGSATRAGSCASGIAGRGGVRGPSALRPLKRPSGP
ncbi:MAG: hypothetical protein WDN69_23315 [Aliidongia sp.]